MKGLCCRNRRVFFDPLRLDIKRAWIKNTSVWRPRIPQQTGQEHHVAAKFFLQISSRHQLGPLTLMRKLRSSVCPCVRNQEVQLGWGWSQQTEGSSTAAQSDTKDFNPCNRPQQSPPVVSVRTTLFTFISFTEQSVVGLVSDRNQPDRTKLLAVNNFVCWLHSTVSKAHHQT